MFEMWLRYEWYVTEISLSCDWDVTELWLRCYWNLTEMWLSCNWEIQYFSKMWVTELLSELVSEKVTINKAGSTVDMTSSNDAGLGKQQWCIVLAKTLNTVTRACNLATSSYSIVLW